MFIDEGRAARATTLFKALGNPLRIHILSCLKQEPCCVHELVEVTGASQPLVSQHLRVLRTAALVKATRRGKELIYELSDQHVIQILDSALTHVGEEE